MEERKIRKTITVREAAREAGVSMETIRYWIYNNENLAIQVGGRWRIFYDKFTEITHGYISEGSIEDENEKRKTSTKEKAAKNGKRAGR